MTQQPFLNHFKLPKNLFNSLTPDNKEVSFIFGGLPKNTIYLDYAASTPLDIRVFEKMSPWLFEYFGNSANTIHPMGTITKHALEYSRNTIAEILNVEAEEIIFTSCATESNNLLLRGLLEHPLQKRKKIITCVTEHSSIASTAKMLSENLGSRLGYEFCELSVDENGQINLEEAKKIIDDKTLCVCVMDVNNETGIVQKTLPQIEQITHAAGALLHIDGVQGFARNDLFALGVNFDSAVISSSKIYGPKGASALIIKKRRPRIQLEPQLEGGGHEFGLRAGTPNIAAIVGFSEACILQKKECAQRLKYYSKLEDAFMDEIKKNIDACFYAESSPKIKGIISLSIANVNAMKLLENTPTVCASVGSACKTLQATASHVLLAMGIELEQALASFRISFGLCNSEEDVRTAARLLAKNALELRKAHAWI